MHNNIFKTNKHTLYQHVAFESPITINAFQLQSKLKGTNTLNRLVFIEFFLFMHHQRHIILYRLEKKEEKENINTRLKSYVQTIQVTVNLISIKYNQSTMGLLNVAIDLFSIDFIEKKLDFQLNISK